eukprot:16416-Amphidinium_carterae.5
MTVTILDNLSMFQRSSSLGDSNTHASQAIGTWCTVMVSPIRVSIKYNAVICNFGEMVLADVKHVTHQKLAICNLEQKVEGMWIGKTTNNGEHIIALKNNGGSIYYTRSLSRMTPDQHWSKELFNTIEVPMMDTTMKPDYSEEAIIDQYFTRVRLNEKQPGHRLWANKQEAQSPPDMLSGENNEQFQMPVGDLERMAPPGLEPAQYVHPPSKAMAKPAGYKPTHCLVGKHSPPIVAQLDGIETTKELALEIEQ